MASRKRKLPNAFRSCKSCKEHKRRCELKDSVLLNEPSLEALKEGDACARCYVLGLPCILDDFDKIEKISSKRRMKEIQGKQENEEQKEQKEQAVQVNQVNPIQNQEEQQLPIPVSSGSTPFPADFEDFKRYNLRSRPITLLSEICIRQPSFANQSSSIAKQLDRNKKSAYELIDDSLALQLSIWCQDHLLIWLPQLPYPIDIRRLRLEGRSLSAPTRILEAAQYVIALQHSTHSLDNSRLLIGSLTRLIESLLSQSVLVSQRDIHAAQALELLSVFPIASSYLTQFTSDKARSLEKTVLASASSRIASVCRQEYQLLHFQDIDNDPQRMSQREFELGIQWCSSAAWEFSHCMASDDVIHFYGNRYTARIDQINDLLNFSRLNKTPGSKGLGQIFVLLRAHLMNGVLDIWTKLHDEIPFALSKVRRTPPRSIKERLDVLGKLLKEYEERCAQSKALRYTWLEFNPKAEAQLLLNWLDIEDLAYFIMITGRTLVYALQEDENASQLIKFTPEYLHKMVIENASDELIRQFMFFHGDSRIDAGECLLMIASSIASLPLSFKHDLVLPTLTTCGFIIEACMLGMEMHGTTAKYWQTLPRRSSSWQTGMKSVIVLLRKINDVPEEEGGITRATSQIVKGMAEVISVWRRAINKAKITQGTFKHPPLIEETNVGYQKDRMTGSNSTNVEGSDSEQNQIGGVDVDIPPLSTDGPEVLSLDHLLRDLFGSTNWFDTLPNVTAP